MDWSQLNFGHLMTLLIVLDLHHQNFNSNFLNSKKLQNFLMDLSSMTNNLLFETNSGVLAQFVLKWQAIKDSYFQVQERVKKQKLIRSEIINALQ